MKRLLTGCTFTQLSYAPHTTISDSVEYQARALGINIAPETISDQDDYCFEFKTPDTSPISSKIQGWADNSSYGATELLVQAASGLMSVHGRASGQAQALGLNYVSTLASTLALQGALAAAIGQLRGLRVAHSQVSMAGAALLATGQYLAGATVREAPEAILPGCTSPSDRPPFVSSDGIIFELETLSADPWLRFWSELGISSETAGKGWTGFLLRYAKAISPIPSVMVEKLAALEYQAIAKLCATTNVAICPVRSLDERMCDVDASQMLEQGPWRYTSHSSSSSHVVPIKQVSNELPLSGLTVIESCRRIQGPLAGHLLALLGAEVIRLEPPGGDPLRGMPPMAGEVSARFDALNRLKTIVEINIKSTAGQKEIKSLVEQADVFLHNWAPGKASALNLNDTDLARINPSLVYAYAGGWGGDESGSNAHHTLPGTDFIAQAHSGIAREIAIASDTRGGSLFTVLDILGGVIAAQGVTAALLHRCMSNRGVRMDSSLLGAATLLSTDKLRQRDKSTYSAISKSPIATVYHTQQDALAIECRNQEEAARMAEILGLAWTQGDETFPHRLQKVLLTKTASQWLEVFEQAAIPAAVVVEDLTEVQHNPRLQPELTTDAYTQVRSPWFFQ